MRNLQSESNALLLKLFSSAFELCGGAAVTYE